MGRRSDQHAHGWYEGTSHGVRADGHTAGGHESAVRLACVHTAPYLTGHPQVRPQPAIGTCGEERDRTRRQPSPTRRTATTSSAAETASMLRSPWPAARSAADWATTMCASTMTRADYNGDGGKTCAARSACRSRAAISTPRPSSPFTASSRTTRSSFGVRRGRSIRLGVRPHRAIVRGLEVAVPRVGSILKKAVSGPCLVLSHLRRR